MLGLRGELAPFAIGLAILSVHFPLISPLHIFQVRQQSPAAEMIQANDDEERACRICFGSVEEQLVKSDDGVISPCKCKGSMKWVHRECLSQWMQAAGGVHKKQCSVCR